MPATKQETKREAPLLSDERIDEFKRELTEDNKAKLARIVDQEMGRAGYSSYRPGSRTHLQIEQRVVSELIFHEVDFADINFEESEPKSKK